MKRLLLSTLIFSSLVHAESVKDREGAVRADKAKMEHDKRWAYNDPDSAFRQAKLTGKPVLVVMRCVPCLACMGLDTAVLMESDSLASLLDQFVCLRVINANSLDLTKFQFDYDLSFSTLFFNADGTVYGRYGSWSHQKNSADQTLASYKRALEAALSVHRAYPANKAALALKQPAPIPYMNSIDIPKLAERYKPELDWNGKVVGSCVHCHMIGDAMRTTYRDQRKPVPDEWLFPMPAPETIGLTLAPDHIATVTDVASGSAADKAGLKVGDEVTAFAGQPLVSTADIAWALHRTGDSAVHEVLVKRSGQEAKLTLELPAGWKKNTDTSGRVSVWSLRGMAAGGLNMLDLSDSERQQRGLGTDGMALWVKGLGMYGPHAAAKNAGFQKDDVLVEVGGIKHRITESRLHGHLMQDHLKGDSIPVKVLRDGRTIELRLPMQ